MGVFASTDDPDRPATSRSSSATTSRPASRRSSPSTPPRSAPPSAAPASTPTPREDDALADVLNLSRGDGLQERAGRPRPRRRQGRHHRRPGHGQDRGAAARLRPLRAVAGRPLLHRLRRRHLRRRTWTSSPASAASSPAAPSRTAAPATPRSSPRTASSRACAPRPSTPGAPPTLPGRRVGVAGVGKVGHHLVEHLVEDGADGRRHRRRPRPPSTGSAATHPRGRRGRRHRRAGRAPTSTSTPRARSAARSTTRPWPRCSAKIVCGAANNQLAHPGIEKQLADRGILYAPDYVVNAGGVIQVADELEGFDFDRAKQRADQDLRHHPGDPPARRRRGRPAGGGRRPARRAPDGRGRPAAYDPLREPADDRTGRGRRC